MTAAAKTKSEVATVERATLVPSQSGPSETGALMAAILRASSDPNVDIVKTQTMMTMYREIIADQKEQAFNDAMADAQKEMIRIVTDKDNTQTRSRYASYAALDRAIRPIYTKHGFALSFDTGDGAPEMHVRVICFVTCHGHKRPYHIDLPADGKGAKGGDAMTRTHATVAATTYGKSALVKLIFNIAISDTADDDGNAAGGGDSPISEEQVEKIQSLIVNVAADIQRFCKYMRVSRIEEIPAKQFDRAVGALEAKRAKA